MEQKIQSQSDYRCLSWHVISVPGTFLLWYFINAWAFLYVKYPSWASYIDYNNKNLLHGKGKRTRKRMVREKAYGKLLGNTIEELGGE